VYLSTVSAWEIAIKTRLKRLELPRPPAEFVPEMISRHSLAVLSISLTHTLHEFELPSLHSDPFDRLLVAQAVKEGMQLVTNDRLVVEYDVPTLW
jgi:PIN domain nuclease of toxin-antitoxin system